MTTKNKEEFLKIIIISVNETLKIKKKHPDASDDIVISEIMKIIQAEEKLKLVGLAAASLALNYQQKHPRTREKDIFQFVINKSSEIINLIGEEVIR